MSRRSALMRRGSPTQVDNGDRGRATRTYGCTQAHSPLAFSSCVQCPTIGFLLRYTFMIETGRVDLDQDRRIMPEADIFAFLLIALHNLHSLTNGA